MTRDSTDTKNIVDLASEIVKFLDGLEGWAAAEADDPMRAAACRVAGDVYAESAQRRSLIAMTHRALSK